MTKKRKIIIGVGIVAIIIVLAIAAIIKNTGMDGGIEEVGMGEEEVLVQKVTEETLEETILVTGKIVADDEQKLYADPESGEIKEILVKENDKVKKGDPLFVYDGTQIQNEFNAAVRTRDMSQNGVSMVQNQISQLTKQIDEMKKQQGKKVNPEDEDAGIGVSAEEIRQLELEKSQLAIELEGAKAEVVAAQAEVNELEKRKTELTVTSKMDGTVVKVGKNQDRTDDGLAEPVIHIVSNAPFKVVGTMSEYDSVKIKQKQEVIIRPKVFKDRDWKGVVESVSQFPTEEGGGEMDYFSGGDMNVTMYPFKVEITDDTKELRQGFHVSLEVNVGGTEKKLVVPHMAIMDEMMLGMDDEMGGIVDNMFGMGMDFSQDDTQFVYVLVDGILERRDIETGKSSDEFVEIISGVQLGELIVINPTPSMFDGMEVASYDEVN